MEEKIRKVTILGWQFAALSELQCVGYILKELEAGQGGWVVTANLDHLRRLVRNPDFAEICRGSSFIVADGMPLIWASRIQKTPLPERVAGSSLVSTLSAGAGYRHRSVFLLGGDTGAADQAATFLNRTCPGLRIAGICCPILGHGENDDRLQVDEIRKLLTSSQPDIVYVALGSPKQEFLINQLRESLPAAWWLGVGISFSYLSGQVKRPPAWIRHTGLEWLYRLLQEPKRLARRYLRDGVPFFVLLMVKATAIGIVRTRANPGGK